MEFSEAIRLGSMLAPQIYGESRSALGTCALAGALDAVGYPGVYTAVSHVWPISTVDVRHPITGDAGWLVLSIVRDLNDGYRWTREQIADWVETIEAAQAQPQPAPVAVEA